MHDRGIQFFQTYQIAEQLDMPNIKEMLVGKYLKSEDITEPALLTIRSIKKVNVAQDGQEAEMKWAMSFDEKDQPMIINNTNIDLAARALGSEDTDDWIGRKIVLYTDPDVMMGSRRVGGLRLRAPKGKAPPPPPKQTAAELDDDIPF